MRPVEIIDKVYWVGAVDWQIRDFHGYSTYKGTTYNAFLVLDDQVTLVDTVKKPFKSDLLRHVGEIIDPAQIDYIIVNHVEMDHSSCLPEIMDLIRPEKIFCSTMGHKNLLAHYHCPDWPYEVVKSGQQLSLGQRTVQFLETRMLHWPDSMFSYFPDDRLLISSDAFGQHWATSQRFDDEVDVSELFQHAAKYYANILLPFSGLVTKLLAQIKEMGLPIEMIAPDHGLIWRGHPAKIVEAYDAWARQQPQPQALIIYDTMWHSTEAMAQAIAEGLLMEGIPVKVFDMQVNHRSEVMTAVLDAGALIFGSSTLNNHLLPRMADMLTYMKGLRPLQKIGASFGSYGWSGEAVGQINNYLEEMKIKVVDPGLKINYVPDADGLQQCQALGRKIGQALKEETKS
ncbi:MAG: flavodoxin domain-containing protein [Desulfobacca sp.]|nr:flavodoxin domain-containing protein [Desulfobacca sp.]